MKRQIHCRGGERPRLRRNAAVRSPCAVTPKVQDMCDPCDCAGRDRGLRLPVPGPKTLQSDATYDSSPMKAVRVRLTPFRGQFAAQKSSQMPTRRAAQPPTSFHSSAPGVRSDNQDLR